MKKLNASLMVGTLVALTTAALAVAQSARPAPASVPSPTLDPTQSIARLRAFTGASNLTDAETSALINSSLKTNAAAQVWARMHFSLAQSGKAADIAMAVRLLENIRAGNTNEAIRRLEAKLDNDIMGLHVDLGEPVLKFELRPRDIELLQWAREYRLKYGHQAGDTNTEARVQEALSAGERK